MFSKMRCVVLRSWIRRAAATPDGIADALCNCGNCEQGKCRESMSGGCIWVVMSTLRALLNDGEGEERIRGREVVSPLTRTSAMPHLPQAGCQGMTGRQVRPADRNCFDFACPILLLLFHFSLSTFCSLSSARSARDTLLLHPFAHDALCQPPAYPRFARTLTSAQHLLTTSKMKITLSVLLAAAATLTTATPLPAGPAGVGAPTIEAADSAVVKRDASADQSDLDILCPVNNNPLCCASVVGLDGNNLRGLECQIGA